MNLFDNEFRELLEAHESTTWSFRVVLNIAVSPEREPQRKFLEECFSSLDESSQAKIKHELKDIEGSYQTLNELIVGGYLAKLGYRVEYDRQIQGKTPDWWVYDSDGKSLFFLDVLTQMIMLPKGEPLSFLGIPEGEVTYGSPEALEKAAPPRKQYDTVIDKVNKYSQIIDDEKIPFLIAVVSDGLIDVPIEDLTRSHYSFIALGHDGKWYGFEGKGVDENGKTIDVFTELEDNEKEGVFKKTKLSGLLDVKVNAFDKLIVRLIQNPESELPVSRDYFPDAELLKLTFTPFD